MKYYLFLLEKKKTYNLLVINSLKTNINSLGEFLISILQESPLCLKYVLFIGFVVSPMYNVFKTYQEKKYNNALEFVYKLYENRDVYRIQPYGVLSVIVIIDSIRIIKSFF